MMLFNFQSNFHAVVLLFHMYTPIILSRHIQTNISNDHKDLTMMPLCAMALFIDSVTFGRMKDTLFGTGVHQCVTFLNKLLSVILTYESLVRAALVI